MMVGNQWNPPALQPVLGNLISDMGCSQNYGPLWVIDYITAPNIYRYYNGTLVLGTTLNPK